MVFDATEELQALVEKTELRKRKRCSTSKLDKYSPEIRAFKREGATLEQLQIWLKAKRIKAATSTISRWLAKNG